MEEVGGAGAEPPQNLPIAAEVVQTVLPLEWSGRKRGAGFFYPVPRFRRRNGNGKNSDSQGFKGGDFFALFAKKYYPSLDGLDSGTDGKYRLLFLIGCAIIFPVHNDKSQIVEVNVMWFWWFMLCCDLMIPLLMIVIGRLMWKRPPQKINSLIGYRTSRSMKNMDTWHFAHHYCGKLWWRIGWIILVPSLIIHLPFYGASDDAIGIVGLILTFIQIAVLIGSIFPTEKALKRTFTEEGLRR